MIAIETHYHLNYGYTIKELERKGLSLTKRVLVHYPSYISSTEDPNMELVCSPDGHIPGELKLYGEEVILTGGYFNSCHKRSFEDVVCSANFHFIRDLIYLPCDFHEPKYQDEYFKLAKKAGFRVQVYYDGQKQKKLFRKPQVNIYYWSSLDAFVKHVSK